MRLLFPGAFVRDNRCNQPTWRAIGLLLAHLVRVFSSKAPTWSCLHPTSTNDDSSLAASSTRVPFLCAALIGVPFIVFRRAQDAFSKACSPYQHKKGKLVYEETEKALHLKKSVHLSSPSSETLRQLRCRVRSAKVRFQSRWNE